MHLQQTKDASRATGGPQYYFHSVPEPVKDFLRRKGACPVVLQTPYGIAGSSFMAVGRDHKLSAAGRAVRGKVGHDRSQQAGGRTRLGRRFGGTTTSKGGVPDALVVRFDDCADAPTTNLGNKWN